MFVYRVVKKRESLDIKNDDFDGLNTFDYQDNEDYLHFFVLPESAEIYQLLKYRNKNEDSLVLQCDIPYELLEDNFGFGMYRWYHPKIRKPFIEVRIKRGKFSDKMIYDSSDVIKDEWKNSIIYERYLLNCVNGRNNPVDVIFNSNGLAIEEVKLKSLFPFLHYFPKEQLIKENIICDDYPNNNDILNDIEFDKLIEEKGFLQRIKDLISSNNFSNNDPKRR